MIFADWLQKQDAHNFADALRDDAALERLLSALYRDAFAKLEYTPREASLMVQRARQIAEDFFDHVEQFQADPAAWIGAYVDAATAQPGGANPPVAAAWQALRLCSCETDCSQKWTAFASQKTDKDRCRTMLDTLQERDLSPYFASDIRLIQGAQLDRERQIRYGMLLGMAYYAELKTGSGNKQSADLTYDACVSAACAQVYMLNAQADASENTPVVSQQTISGAAFVGILLLVLYLFTYRLPAMVAGLSLLLASTSQRAWNLRLLVQQEDLPMQDAFLPLQNTAYTDYFDVSDPQEEEPRIQKQIPDQMLVQPQVQDEDV